MLKSRAFLLGVVVTLVIVGIVLLMASRMQGQPITTQAVLTERVWLPIVRCGEGCATPTPTPLPASHRVKSALSQCCSVTCEKVLSYGPDWVSGWSPQITRCGLPSSPMIRDMNQWAAVKNGTYDLSLSTMPIQMFNEPENMDCAAGACISLQTLITATHEIIEAYPNKELASPAFLPTWTQAAYDLVDWVDGYQAEYGVYPRFEVLAMHMYGGTSLGTDWHNSFNITAADFDTILSQLATRGYTGLRVWITEMGWWEWNPDTWIPQMNARFFLQAWIDKCNADSRCEYMNWFAITNTGYGFVMPLEFNGQLTMPGQTWKSEFN